MAEIHREAKSNLSIDGIWAKIGDFYAIHIWVPGINATVKDPSRVNTRILTFSDGSTVSEELIERRYHSYRYRLLPGNSFVHNYESTIAVHEDPSTPFSVISWDASLRTEVGDEARTIAIIGGFFQAGLDTLS